MENSPADENSLQDENSPQDENSSLGENSPLRSLDIYVKDIYFAAVGLSAGYTLISTRRFFAWLSGSALSAGLSHAIPAVAN